MQPGACSLGRAVGNPQCPPAAAAPSTPLSSWGRGLVFLLRLQRPWKEASGTVVGRGQETPRGRWRKVNRIFHAMPSKVASEM